jgi:hypothetical protein
LFLVSLAPVPNADGASISELKPYSGDLGDAPIREGTNGTNWSNLRGLGNLLAATKQASIEIHASLRE